MEDYYKLVTEDMILQRVQDAMLPQDDFDNIRQDVKQLLESQDQCRSLPKDASW